ncbi:MAG: uroporphyrinogen decarboxylase [Actinomycetaceae bacterium]|nr:uroporphyrinogen decarboxylase [Actinomycetaceae bacterium]
MSLSSTALQQALSGARPQRTPVWFMRQAGRSLPEYHEARGTTAMLDACLTPELAAELTLQPVRRYGVDAAIFYSDIMVPLKLAGVDVDIVRGRGPVFASPVRSAEDVARLVEHRVEDWSPITEAVSLVARELPEQTSLLGFAGAPFTLASYIIEGAPSKDHMAARAFMQAEPEAWDALANWCADVSGAFLRTQVDAGACGVQLFDSWAGSLHPQTYERYVLPYSTRALSHVTDVPRIHFAVGASHLLELMARPASALGVDWRISLDEAARRVPDTVLQGNLDPATLFMPEAELLAAVDRVLEAGQSAPAHIFNLGHGVPPNADVGKLQLVVDYVHEHSNKTLKEESDK